MNNISTIIRYNGSRFLGSSHASIEALLELLTLEPLDYEMFNSFVSLAPNGLTLISGNFFRVSHAFAIETNDTKLLLKFQQALEQNFKLNKYNSFEKEISSKALECMRDYSIPYEDLNKEAA